MRANKIFMLSIRVGTNDNLVELVSSEGGRFRIARHDWRLQLNEALATFDNMLDHNSLLVLIRMLECDDEDGALGKFAVSCQVVIDGNLIFDIYGIFTSGTISPG
jgi:hypothetical protein